jgi:hypothetical protein
MSRDEETFLRRWSRRKSRPVEATRPVPASQGAQPPPALPAPETLQFDSDFAAFMQAKVEETVRRAALKKLFSDPRFNVMDGLDIYIDDYTREDPIPQAMLAQLEHARDALFGPKGDRPSEETPDKEEVAAERPAEEAPKDA